MTTTNKNDSSPTPHGDVSISVYVANAKKRNEGQIVGGWIDLPVTDEELNTFLTDTVGIDPDIPPFMQGGWDGYIIHDYDFENGLELLGYKPDEYTDINAINLLAKYTQLANLQGTNLDKVKAYMAQQPEAQRGPIQFTNAITQAYLITFYEYHLPDSMTVEDCSSLTEALGYELALSFPGTEITDFLNTPLPGNLHEITLKDCFDFEAYGHIWEGSFTATPSGFLDHIGNGPKLNAYGDLKLSEWFDVQFYEIYDLTPETFFHHREPENVPNDDLSKTQQASAIRKKETNSPASSKDNATRAVSARKDQSAPGRSNLARS